jgi:hypothetical protein
MAKQGLDGFLVPHEDEHQNEYLPAANDRLAWASGFTGSAGAGVIMSDRAAVFVDGRYTLQVREQVDQGVFEIRDLVEGGVPAYLETARSGAVIGYDARLHSPQALDSLKAAAAKVGAAAEGRRGQSAGRGLGRATARPARRADRASARPVRRRGLRLQARPRGRGPLEPRRRRGGDHRAVLDRLAVQRAGRRRHPLAAAAGPGHRQRRRHGPGVHRSGQGHRRPAGLAGQPGVAGDAGRPGRRPGRPGGQGRAGRSRPVVGLVLRHPGRRRRQGRARHGPLHDAARLQERRRAGRHARGAPSATVQP